jgi:membrane associated rhomboid family serine protease
MIIPIGTEIPSFRRLPWITLGIIVANLAAFLTVGLEGHRAAAQAATKLEAATELWRQHPYLDLPPEFMERAVGAERGKALALAIEGVQERLQPGDAPLRAEQQRELNALVEGYLATRLIDPYRSWGLVTARVEPLAVLKSMFMHLSWLHLIGNLVWLWVTAPFLEEAFGRWLFPVFYLLSGAVAALVHFGAQPGSDVPLVGASGAIAALMGAFLVRFWNVKIRFFYWFLFIFVGTFRARAWIMLPLWLLLQLAFVSLVGSGSGVALWAHIGGFGFGFAFAYVLGFTHFEERFVHPQAGDRLMGMRHPAFEQAATALQRRNPTAAREAYQRVLRDLPGSQEALLGLWQVEVMAGRPADGVPSLVRAIENDMRDGDAELALHHWRELVACTRQGGPPPLRWKLGCALEPRSAASAMEVFRDLAEDPSAGLLATKAIGRVAALMPSDDERKLWEKRLAGSETQTGVGAGTAVSPSGASTPRAAATPPAGPSEPTFAGPVVEHRNLDGLGPAGLLLSGGESEVLPYDSIAVVAVAAITREARPYLLLDLVLAPVASHPRTVIRVDSRGLDPRRLIERPDLPPMEAFRELVRRIAAASGGVVVPRTERGVQVPSFDTVEHYEAAVLRSLV